MQILLRSVKVVDATSQYNGKIVDILIEDGTISQIGTELDSSTANEIIEGDDLHVSTGWVDMYATFGDPGREHKEDIESGLTAAAQGGFTKVAVSPESEPAMDNKSAVEYLLSKSKNHVVDALPIGGITKGLKGKELSEMFDMQSSGAVGVSNGKHAVDDPKVQNLAFQYGKNLNLAVYSFCQDSRLANGGQMHEGDVNTRIGLKGIPALAEELAITRDLYLAEYSDVAVHVSHVTTKGGVELIREAKEKGIKVTASVPVHHIMFSDESISDFEPNYKVCPPFRGKEHIEALKNALADGTIDTVISDHEPHEIEAKFSEFSIAESGVIALESAFSVAIECLSDSMTIEQIIEMFTTKPRTILNLNNPSIAKGETAELTIFTPSLKWIYVKDEIKSRSKNSPLLNKELTGLPVAIFNNGKLYLNS